VGHAMRYYRLCWE